jgi:type I restriction enzyme S subunit
MRQDFQTKKLGEVIELAYGKGISKVERHEDGQCIVYGANGELGRTDKFLVEGEAIIVGRKGSVGELHRVSGKFWPSDVTYYVFGNDQIDVDYLFNFLKSQKLQRFAAGVKPGLNRNRVYELEIQLPPIDEQKRIVKILENKLGKVKEAIQLRQDAIADTKKILSAKLNEIFASEKEKEWEEKTLGECVKLQGGNAFKSTDYQDEKGVPLIRIQNLKNEVVDLTKAVYLSYQIFEDSGNFHLESGDILIAMSGATTGKLARIKEGQLPALLNQRVGRFKVNSYAIKNFVYYFLKYKQSHILEIAYGGAQPNISGGKIEALKISLPNLKKQKQLVNELDKLVGQIDELKSLQEEQMKDLKSLERAYLHEAFSGELA